MNDIIHIYYSDLQGESFALEAYTQREAKDLIKVHFEEFKQMPYLVKANNFLTYQSVVNYSVALAQGVNHG